MTDVTHLRPEPYIEGERWREYTRFPGYYVSDHGRVIGRRGRLLKPAGEYPHFKCEDIQVKVHHAVAETFIGPRVEGYFVLHKDDDQNNNRLSNLRYGTQFENSDDARRNGRMALGSKNGAAILNEDNVREIKASKGVARKDLAARYGVSIQAIQNIFSGAKWKHV